LLLGQLVLCRDVDDTDLQLLLVALVETAAASTVLSGLLVHDATRQSRGSIASSTTKAERRRFTARRPRCFCCFNAALLTRATTAHPSVWLAPG
jgi:hypothetical protein